MMQMPQVAENKTATFHFYNFGHIYSNGSRERNVQAGPFFLY